MSSGLLVAHTFACDISSCDSSIAVALAQLVASAAHGACNEPILIAPSLYSRASLTFALDSTAVASLGTHAASGAVFSCGTRGVLGIAVRTSGASGTAWPQSVFLSPSSREVGLRLLQQVAFASYGCMSGAVAPATGSGLLVPVAADPGSSPTPLAACCCPMQLSSRPMTPLSAWTHTYQPWLRD